MQDQINQIASANPERRKRLSGWAWSSCYEMDSSASPSLRTREAETRSPTCRFLERIASLPTYRRPPRPTSRRDISHWGRGSPGGLESIASKRSGNLEPCGWVRSRSEKPSTSKKYFSK